MLPNGKGNNFFNFNFKINEKKTLFANVINRFSYL